MFVRVKKVGPYRYLQIDEDRREGKRIKQSIIATLGRLDKLTASGAIDQLLRSAARFAERIMVLSEHAHDGPDANVLSIGPALIFERLWRDTGCQAMVRKLLATRHHRFDVERAVLMTVAHRLMVSGSDRSALQWRRDQAIEGTEALELQHLYRAMGWLGEALGECEPDALSPRRTKDLIEEELLARRRDLFTDLDLVFFDTTSLFFTGDGGETLGQYGKSKDRRNDCKQMVLGMVIDADGVPVCSEMWPGNTTDVTTLDQVAGRLHRRFGVRRVCLVTDASGRRCRDGLEEDDCGGRGARVAIHSWRATASDQRGPRRGAGRPRRVRDHRGYASARRPDGTSSQGGHGRRYRVQGGGEGITPAPSLCRVPQSGPGPQGCGHAGAHPGRAREQAA